MESSRDLPLRRPGDSFWQFYRQIAQMDQRYTDEIEARYDEMRCPVRIIWGEEDSWIPLERGRELAQRIPGSSLRVVPEAGHLVQEDAPEALVAALLGDLAITAPDP